MNIIFQEDHFSIAKSMTRHNFKQVGLGTSINSPKRLLKINSIYNMNYFDFIKTYEQLSSTF